MFASEILLGALADIGAGLRVPIVGMMDIDEFEDYLELRDPKARADIRKSTEEYLAGKHRPAELLLDELRAPRKPAKSTRRQQP